LFPILGNQCQAEDPAPDCRERERLNLAYEVAMKLATTWNRGKRSKHFSRPSGHNRARSKRRFRRISRPCITRSTSKPWRTPTMKPFLVLRQSISNVERRLCAPVVGFLSRHGQVGHHRNDLSSPFKGYFGSGAILLSGVAVFHERPVMRNMGTNASIPVSPHSSV
jgi:hypothetical protein